MCRCLMGISLGMMPVIGAAQQPSRVADVRPVQVAPGVGDVFARLVTLQVRNVSLEQAVEKIAERANVRIQYRLAELEAVAAPVSLQADKVPLRQVLDQVLAGSKLAAVWSGGNMITITRTPAAAQLREGIIAGVVRHEKTRQPIAGATVTLEGHSQKVETGADGTFRFTVPAGEYTVRIRSVGHASQTRRTSVPDGESVTLEFALASTASILDEVVVTGTIVATERKTIPYPITVITANDIEARGITRMEQLLRGMVPGVIALEQGSQSYEPELGSTSRVTVYSRGASTMEGGATPLKTYVDGVELFDPTYLGTIDPRTIERIEVITGPQAATLYGSGAMGGVMQIFTKKGSGRSAPDVMLSLKYGMLENNLSAGRTPAHTDALNVTGGTGPAFSYAVTLSHDYTGQWQPSFYRRSLGGSAGVTHAQGPFTATGSFSVTAGSNGIVDGGYPTGPLATMLEQSGEWQPGHAGFMQSTARSNGQTASFSMDYRPFPGWQHHLTLGRNMTGFELDPQAPNFVNDGDTLYKVQSLSGVRTTISYNTTLQHTAGPASAVLTLGADGSRGNSTTINGCRSSETATGYISCYWWEPLGLSVNRPVNDQSWGTFGSIRLGVLDRLFLTFGLRGERNPDYGELHKIDWTPTNGISYVAEYGDLTAKVRGSYGRATRPPAPTQRLEVIRFSPWYEPAQYVEQRANPNLTPEYSRGPQIGLDLFYGNRVSLSVNHYTQTVASLIQYLGIDSTPVLEVSSGMERYISVYQFVNSADVRQRGWEFTGTTTVSAFTVQGTYSMQDSRILSVHPSIAAWYATQPKTFIGVPARNGNVTMTYARGGTSVTFVNNIMGRISQDFYYSSAGRRIYFNSTRSRIFTYVERSKTTNLPYKKPAYIKSDLNMSHRVASAVTLTLNVANLGNSYGSDASVFYPALGRQTSLGVSLRHSRR